MIFEDSRYRNVATQPIFDATGRRQRAIPMVTYYATRFIAQRYTLKQDERLEQIAWQVYRDPEKWWVIAVANPEVLYPDRIPAGTVLRIPDASAVR